MKKRTLLSVFFIFLFFIVTQIIFSSIGFMIQGAEISSTFLIFPVIGDVVFALSAFLYSKKKKLMYFCIFSLQILSEKFSDLIKRNYISPII